MGGAGNSGDLGGIGSGHFRGLGSDGGLGGISGDHDNNDNLGGVSGGHDGGNVRQKENPKLLPPFLFFFFFFFSVPFYFFLTSLAWVCGSVCELGGTGRGNRRGGILNRGGTAQRRQFDLKKGRQSTQHDSATSIWPRGRPTKGVS